MMSKLLSRINRFVKMKRWEKRWGNPIRAAHEPNPFYGLAKDPSTSPPQDGARAHQKGLPDLLDLTSKDWETKGRLKLMDSGLSNNLPHREHIEALTSAYTRLTASACRSTCHFASRGRRDHLF